MNIPTCKTCRYFLSGAEFGNCTKPFQDGAIEGIITAMTQDEANEIISKEIEEYLNDVDLDDIDDLDDLSEILDSADMIGIAIDHFEDATKAVGMRTHHDFGCNLHSDYDSWKKQVDKIIDDANTIFTHIHKTKTIITREDVMPDAIFKDKEGKVWIVEELTSTAVFFRLLEGTKCVRDATGIDEFILLQNHLNAKRYAP